MTTLPHDSVGGFSNTPLNSQDANDSTDFQSCPIGGFSVSIDFFSGTFTIPKIQPLLDFILPADEVWVRYDNSYYTMGNYNFTAVATTQSGVRVRWLNNEDGTVTGHLNLPGAWFKPLDLLDQCRHLRGLSHAYKLKSTRIDTALDDYRREITYELLENTIESGDFAGFRVAEPYSGTLVRGKDGVERRPATMYMGSKNSKKRVVFYDAEFKHGIAANRWELRYREDYANAYFQGLCHDSQEWFNYNRANDERGQRFGQCLASFVSGAIDFVRHVDKNLSRCPRLGWWQRFLDMVGETAKLKVPQKVRTLQTRLNWMQRQVAKTLGILRHGWGAKEFHIYLKQLIDDASWRMTDEDLGWIEHLSATSQ